MSIDYDVVYVRLFGWSLDIFVIQETLWLMWGKLTKQKSTIWTSYPTQSQSFQKRTSKVNMMQF